ncbi:MAG: GntR family transcriptional regulator [Clostridia bacterium]|nr:GntR family transcriptional regulator [Clostridia bacterium]
MKVIVSNSSDKPLYEQIEEQIKELIFNGELVDGDVLPPIRMLANEVHVSILTIRRVYEELEKEGFLSSKVGRGTFVACSNLEAIKEAKRIQIERRLSVVVDDAKAYGICRQELLDMIMILFQEVG